MNNEKIDGKRIFKNKKKINNKSVAVSGSRIGLSLQAIWRFIERQESTDFDRKMPQSCGRMEKKRQATKTY